MTEAELTHAECADLLATDTVGRVAFVTSAGPRIIPVNYVLVGDGVEFRTTAYSELAVDAVAHAVAFEVDHLDPEHKRGWSVVAHGTCTRVEEPRPEEGGPEPWAGGHRSLLLRLEWRELTGRRVGGDHWPHPAVSGRGRSY